MITKWFKKWCLSDREGNFVDGHIYLREPIRTVKNELKYVYLCSNNNETNRWHAAYTRMFLYPTNKNCNETIPDLKTSVNVIEWNYSAGYISMCYGSGTTPPTPNDYHLENNITTLIIPDEPLYDCFYNENTNCLNITFTGSGIATTDCVISEVGIIKSFRATEDTSATDKSTSPVRSAENFLVSRDLLPKPITLKKDDSFTVTVILEI